jgi:hypothetical protein
MPCCVMDAEGGNQKKPNKETMQTERGLVWAL